MRTFSKYQSWTTLHPTKWVDDLWISQKESVLIRRRRKKNWLASTQNATWTVQLSSAGNNWLSASWLGLKLLTEYWQPAGVEEKAADSTYKFVLLLLPFPTPLLSLPPPVPPPLPQWWRRKRKTLRWGKLLLRVFLFFFSLVPTIPHLRPPLPAHNYLLLLCLPWLSSDLHWRTNCLLWNFVLRKTHKQKKEVEGESSYTTAAAQSEAVSAAAIDWRDSSPLLSATQWAYLSGANAAVWFRSSTISGTLK